MIDVPDAAPRSDPDEPTKVAVDAVPLPLLDKEAQLLAFAEEIGGLIAKERDRAAALERALRAAEESLLGAVQMAAFMVEAKDPNTRSHLDRTHGYAIALARRVAPELADDRAFTFGFLLHDVGKFGIPEHVLSKAGPLTREEWEVMKTHPILGASMLDRVPYLKRAASIVEAHHERWDGQGYPHGLRGQEIPFGARIFAVVDTFDAMTSDRPYRRALSVEQAVEAILAAAGSQLDPQLAKEFAELCRERMGTWPLEHPEPGDVR